MILGKNRRAIAFPLIGTFCLNVRHLAPLQLGIVMLACIAPCQVATSPPVCQIVAVDRDKIAILRSDLPVFVNRTVVMSVVDHEIELVDGSASVPIARDHLEMQNTVLALWGLS